MNKRQAAATTTQKSTSTPIARPTRKRQADRLLKQLPLCDRKLQTQLRHQIMNDPIFSGA